MNAPVLIREALREASYDAAVENIDESPDAAPIRDRAWWAAEAERTRTDWDSLIASHLSVLAMLGHIEPPPSSFELACRRADARSWRFKSKAAAA
jgi:hypothetical protein